MGCAPHRGASQSPPASVPRPWASPTCTTGSQQMLVEGRNVGLRQRGVVQPPHCVCSASASGTRPTSRPDSRHPSCGAVFGRVTHVTH